MQTTTDAQLLALFATDTPEDPAPVITLGPRVTLPDGRDTRAISVAWLRANVDLDTAVETWRRFAPPDPNIVDQPWAGTSPPLGTWSFNPRMCDWSIYLAFDPALLVNGESEEDGRAHLTFPIYAAWAMQGHTPPPITVVRQNSGRLNSLNRRRLLVARDMGQPIGAWFSETTQYGGAYWRLPQGRKFADTAEILQVRNRYVRSPLAG